MYAEDEARLIVDAAAGDADRLRRLVDRRRCGEPLELVVGFAEFAGHRVAVAPGVFVPRRGTAGLVDLATAVLARRPPPHLAVDFGCGSGALLLALLHRAPCEAYAIDVSDAAVRCARENLRGTGATVLAGDRLSVLPDEARGRVDVVLANLPYVPTARLGEMPREARLFEPAAALDGGVDGLEPMRAALRDLEPWLGPHGSYLCELHDSQLREAARVAERYGYVLDEAADDDWSGGTLVRISRRW